ncbi:MAG: hypothetical protein K2I42_02975 [Anaeroplasmataceae bacterium]|nr:hypothetical protein [Anaeroplasmataceae bacterium]
MKKVGLFALMSVLIVVSVLFGFKAAAQELSPYQKCLEINEYLLSNFSELKNSYNSNHEDKLSADSLEGFSLIKILDDECYGIYADFNDNFGYMLMDFDFRVYEIKTVGDLEYLKDVKFAYYHTVDGFMYEQDGKLVKYNEIETEEVTLDGAGQLGSGEGLIYSLSTYVADQYPNATLAETQEKALAKYAFTTSQIRTSYYVIEKGATVKPEDNCAITAAFNVLTALHYMDFMPGVPDKSDTVDLSLIVIVDQFYDDYGTGNNSKGYTVNNKEYLRKTYETYRIIRNYAVQNLGYKPDHGLTTSQTKTLIDYGSSHYNHPVNWKQESTFSNAKNSLDEGRAVLVGLVNSKDYGNHAVAALGYRRYTVTTNWGSYTSTTNYYFLVLDDGVNSMFVYYDLAKATGSIKTEYIFY